MPNPTVVHIGLTGGIGSGKTRAANWLQTKGFAIYNADDRGKALLNENEQLKAQVTQAFGPEVYHPDGSLNRAALGQRVFADAEALKQLNALVHPAVVEDHANWAAKQAKTAKPGQVVWLAKEAAIMLEANTAKGLDGLVLVYAPKSVRLQRTAARDGHDLQAVRQRMDKQWADRRKLLRADWVIYNDGLNPLEPQLEQLLAHWGWPDRPTLGAKPTTG